MVMVVLVKPNTNYLEISNFKFNILIFKFNLKKILLFLLSASLIDDNQ